MSLLKVGFKVIKMDLGCAIAHYNNYNLLAVVETSVNPNGIDADRYFLTHEHLGKGSQMSVDMAAEVSPLKKLASPLGGFKINDKPVQIYRPLKALKDTFRIVNAFKPKDVTDGRFPVGTANLKKNFYEAAQEVKTGYEEPSVIVFTSEILYPDDILQLQHMTRLPNCDALRNPMFSYDKPSKFISKSAIMDAVYRSCGHPRNEPT